MQTITNILNAVIEFMQHPLHFDGWTFSLWQIFLWTTVGGIIFWIIGEFLYNG